MKVRAAIAGGLRGGRWTVAEGSVPNRVGRVTFFD
jgi:hypothetical protein